MAAVSSPYGLKAVNHLGGTPYAGSTRMYPIASGYAANLYNGSVVSVVAAGVTPPPKWPKKIKPRTAKKRSIGAAQLGEGFFNMFRRRMLM